MLIYTVVLSAILSTMYVKKRYGKENIDTLSTFVFFVFISSLWMLTMMVMTFGVLGFIIGGYLTYNVMFLHYQILTEYDNF